jgi:nicotinamide-nucleotide amidase
MAATAESCTGGWIAKVLTDIAGSSQWFAEGFVTYSNEAKLHRLGVPRSVLKADGAVSEAAARAMARGALARSGAHLAVAVTGIAGPGGAVPGKPVGTVWMAWAIKRGRMSRVSVELRQFKGDRDTVRRKTVRAAMAGMLIR